MQVPCFGHLFVPPLFTFSQTLTYISLTPRPDTEPVTILSRIPVFSAAGFTCSVLVGAPRGCHPMGRRSASDRGDTAGPTVGDDIPSRVDLGRSDFGVFREGMCSWGGGIAMWRDYKRHFAGLLINLVGLSN